MRASFDRRISRIESELLPEEEESTEPDQVVCLDPRSPEQRQRIRKGIYAVLTTMYPPHAQLVIEDLKQNALKLYLWHFGTEFNSGGKTYRIYRPGELKLTGEILWMVIRWRGECPLKMPQGISQFFLDHSEDRDISLSDPCKECGLRHPGRGLSSSDSPIFPRCTLCSGQVITFSVMLEKKIGYYWPYEKLRGVAPGYRLEDLDAVIVPDGLDYDFDPETIKRLSEKWRQSVRLMSMI